VPWEQGTASGRYLEIWNLVFMQFERRQDGSLEPLPNPSIDTGAGLERVTAVLQDVASNYDTDLFRPMLAAAAELAKTKYGEDPAADVSLRVIADHLRAVVFLLADGVIPANDGRGYVLRRLLRRAVRHGMRLGFEDPFLHGLVPVVSSVMGDAYPELAVTAAATTATIKSEEEKFLNTVAAGARRVQEAVEEVRRQGGSALPGDAVFRLYDTYGLPLEMVREIAEEERLAVDEASFAEALENQRRRSRAATDEHQGHAADFKDVLAQASERLATEFLGYDHLFYPEARAALLLRLDEDRPRKTESLDAGERGVAVFEPTVFYAEAGGQVGDQGAIRWPGGSGRVVDTRKDASGAHLHFVTIEAGRLDSGAKVELEVAERLRRNTERNHTATHLLHAALRQRLGSGVRQMGSLVHPERLRFDFSYHEPLLQEDRDAIEDLVNEWIRRAVPTVIEWRGYRDAVSRGAMALFGEKYGDRVRTVDVPGFSRELCGGCHVRNTGEIGDFVLVAEKGTASGVRRIEALTGEHADRLRRKQELELRQIEEELGVSGERAAAEIAALKRSLRETEKELARLRMKVLSGAAAGGDGEEIEVAGVRVLTREVPPGTPGDLRSLADVLRQRLGSGVVVLGARDEQKVSVVTAVTGDLLDRVDAGALARRLGDLVGGSGGGRRDFAQAGGRDPSRLQAALAAAGAAVEEQLSGSASQS
jgi:alanyl-tRNA synthetase